MFQNTHRIGFLVDFTPTKNKYYSTFLEDITTFASVKTKMAL